VPENTGGISPATTISRGEPGLRLEAGDARSHRAVLLPPGHLGRRGGAPGDRAGHAHRRLGGGISWLSSPPTSGYACSA